MQRIIWCLLLFPFMLNGQSLPTQWRKTDDGKFLIAGDQISNGLYDESNLEEVRIYFTQPNYWNLLAQYYNSKTDIPCRIMYKGMSYDSVGIRFKGQTSYFMNSSQKKSFNISMDAFRENVTLAGYKTLNLNNSWTDPSFMREVLYYRLIRTHSPAAKANFMRVYINDQDWGIYQNVQQLNKDFLEEWYDNNDGINIRADRPDGSSAGPGGPGGMWGDGTAGMNYLGQDTNIYKQYYTLKSSGINNPWQKLVEACQVLNNTPVAYLEDEAQKTLDIDKILWHLACEIAFGDDDSYAYKGKMDYYLYYDPVTGRWATYDYDANSTFLTAHITWSPFYNANKVNYPLLNKLLQVPAFRQRYLAHVRTIISESLNDDRINQLITSYDNLIRPAVFADPKKVTTNTAYTNELNVLKGYVKNRRASLLANAEVKAVSPLIENANYTVNGEPFASVTEKDRVVVQTAINFEPGVYQVWLYYGTGLTSTFQKIEMHDDGKEGDLVAGDKTWSVRLPSFSPGTMVRFYVEGIGNDDVKSRSYFPAGAEHQLMIFSVEPEIIQEKKVVINEFMASNSATVKDGAGEYEDWIELHNISSEDVNLSGYYITDNPSNLTKFALPEGTILKAGAYMIIWADEDQEQGPLHVNFKLSAAGETIMLLTPQQVIADSVVFGQQTENKSMARKPNGTGNFVIGDHTFGYNNDSTSGTEDGQPVPFRMHPNPTTDQVYVSYEGVGIQRLEIIGLHGEKIRETDLEKDQTISFDLPAGMYLLRMGSTSKKLIVLPR
jgi:hypothetical protein